MLRRPNGLSYVILDALVDPWGENTVSIGVVLDCVTWGEILNHPYDGQLLVRHKVTQAMAES